MDNNLPEVEIYEKKDYTVFLIIILLFLLGLGGWYVLSEQKKSSITPNNDNAPITNSEQSELVKTISIEGTVLSVDPIKNELSVNVSSLKDSLLSVENTDVRVKDRIIKVTQGTVIQKLVIAKNPEGVIDRSGSIEMNISDIKVNDKILVSYNGLVEDRELSNVQNISLVIDTDNFDQTYQVETQNLETQSQKMSYVKGKVLSINDTNIEYSPYALGGLSPSKYFLAIADNTKIYSLSDSSRINIEHVRSVASVGDIKVGSDIYIAVDESKETSQGITSSDTVIVISK